MDLWVRSQDKQTLIKIDRIDVDGNSIIVWQNNYNCDEIYLGSYKSKERTLEVLNEIDEFVDLLNNNLLGISDDGIHRRHSVYQMPKE